MSEQDNKIKEKSKENISEPKLEEKLEDYDNLAASKGTEKNSKDQKIIAKENSIKEIKNKNQRLSCQPILSFMKRHGSNYSIRPIPLRKKTTADYYRINDDNNLLATLIQSKTNSKRNLKNKEEEKYNKKNNNLDDFNIIIDPLKNGCIKLKSKLNLYQREKNYLKRKENYIKKKKDLQLKEIKNNSKGPFINRNSEIIMENKPEYIPIQNRARKIHSRHLFECILNENRLKLKKLEEEDKEYEIVKQYKNRKVFNKNDWENFIKSQEYWKKEKQYKIKAAELFKENIEQKTNYIPEIDKNSKLMIENMKKKEINKEEDNIYIRLYNDFDDLQEKRKMRICNSMPSFKPLLNKSFKKSIFSAKKKNNKNKMKLSQKLDLLIKSKLNRSKSLSNIPTKFTSTSYIKNLGFKNNKNNFILNNINLNKIASKNKKPNRYDNNYFEELNILSKTNNDIDQNTLRKTKLIKNNVKYKNNTESKNVYNVNNKNCINKCKNEFVFNGSRNSFIYYNSKVIKEEQQ